MKTMNVVGVDLGSHSVKVVQLENSDTGSKLISCASKEIFEGKEYNPEGPTADQILETLNACLAEAKVNPKKAKALVTSIGGQSTHVKQIKSVPLSAEELNSSLIFEARKHLPLDEEQPLLDFQILRGDANSTDMDVMLVATSRKAFDKHREILKDTGFPADDAIIDVDVLALANSILMQKKAESDGLTIILEVGARSSNILVLGKDSPFFSRSIQIGGHKITEDLAENKKMTYLDAENFKRSNNIFESKAEEGGLSLQMVQKNSYEQLMEELKRSLRYYAKENSNSAFKEVLVCGGGAKIPGFVEYINKNLNLATSAYNPMAMISGGVADTQYTQAVGLALRRE